MSIYENSDASRSRQRSGMALGRIYKVDVSKRLCNVKTYFGPPEFLDLDCREVQWLSMDANAQGDEGTAIPRVGSLAVVLFIETEVFVYGYLKALNSAGAALTGNEAADLVIGDKILSTRAGNRILVRTNGSIEFTSKETLKTVYIPTDSRILQLCRNLNFKADGGYINWEVDITGQTKHTVEYRRDLVRSIVIQEDRGNVGGALIESKMIGPGVPGVAGVPTPFYKKDFDVTGASKELFGLDGTSLTTEKTADGAQRHVQLGDFSVVSRLGKFLAELDVGDAQILAKLGNVLVEATAGRADVKAMQGITLTSDAGEIAATATTRAVKLTGSQAQLILENGMVALGGPTAELLDLFDQLMDALSNAFTSSATETHVGNLGYSTSPPVNAADYITAVTLITQIRALLGTIKRGL